MNPELPEHLQATAALLSRSLPRHCRESSPAIPADLLGDLSRKSVVESPSAKLVWFERARSWVSSPAFGLAAAALVVIGFFAPALMNPAGTAAPQETFRGTHVVNTTSNAAIVLITDHSDTRRLLEESGLFDMSIVIETSDPLVAATIPSAKLIVDVNGGAIVAYNAESREILADQLPEDRSKTAERIALAFGALN